MDSKTTISGLFNGRVQFSVPNYQRAYAWRVSAQGNTKDSQVNQFLEDIKEQDENHAYYLGHFLFETLNEHKGHFAIIDGQQRLTTVVIFVSSIVKAFQAKGQREINGEPIELIRQYYLENFGDKFVTVPDDSHYFRERVIEGKSDASRVTERKSEGYIKEAADFFDKEFANADIVELSRWFKIIHAAKVTTYCLEGEDARLTATQIFSFQNDRGKSLTVLEKLKAYLMHQIYKYSADNATDNIKTIDSHFSDIINLTERLHTHEDTILNWHCQAFLSSWEPAFESVKHEVAIADDKSRWILSFVADLRKTFNKMLDIEGAEKGYCSYITDICYLDKSNSMPLILKLAHYTELELRGYNSEPLRYIERILFKLKFTIGDYRTNSLIQIAKNYKKNNYIQLVEDLKYRATNGFHAYWDFTKDCRRFFEENNKHYRSDLRYVLYKYENYLRLVDKIPLLPIEECSNIFKETSVQNTLDHITPENPDFTQYSEDFKNRFLCNIGNLSLLVWSKNSSKNCHDPVKEKEKYSGVYLAQKKIYDVLCGRNRWSTIEIAERRKEILSFIFKNWELGDCDNIKDMEPETQN